ncbi:MAG: lspA [Alphaproteobacteria bacterium]|jgi:signal peptidase II|nr:lspA [Alphaproteobacteria bacterium]
MSEQVIRPGRYFIVAFFLILVVIGLDQASKWFVMESMLRVKSENPDFWTWFTTRDMVEYFSDQQEEYKQVVFNDWLNFTMVWNRGISFGMFGAGAGKTPLLFIALSMLISLGLLIWLVLARTKMLFFALPLIIGGAIGNVIDRVRFGAVADFIDMHLGDRHWPAYNIADACVVIGAIFLILDTIFDKSGSKKDPKNA